MRMTPALAALALGLTLTLSACGTDDASTATTTTEVSTTEHNDADVEFASNMLQHHAQALSMVDLTINRTLDPEVQQVTEQIRDAQAPEIETFTEWLTDWDEEIPETMRDHANAGHDMDDMSETTDDMDHDSMDHGDMPGMMTVDDMGALEDASDAEFQAMWLAMMVEHHAGAVEMAKDEQGDGQYKPAIDLAGDIVASQSDEVDKMKGLLGAATTETGSSTPPWPAPTDVGARVAAAGLDLGPMGTAEHYHPNLRVIIDGIEVAVPTNIGVDPTTGAMSAVHTHDGDGTIHIEADTVGEVFTLGQVFTQWGVDLTSTQIGGVKAAAGQDVTVTSNGKPVTGDPMDLRLEPDQQIVVELG